MLVMMMRGGDLTDSVSLADTVQDVLQLHLDAWNDYARTDHVHLHSSTFALAFAVILHPSLLTRLILVAVFTPIGLVMCLLPIARTQHVFVRLAMASVGAFGTILAIALLAHIPS